MMCPPRFSTAYIFHAEVIKTRLEDSSPAVTSELTAIFGCSTTIPGRAIHEVLLDDNEATDNHLVTTVLIGETYAIGKI